MSAKRILVAGAATALVVVTAGGMLLLGQFGGAAAQKDGEAFSIESTPIGRLLDTACTRDVFVHKLGAAEMVESPAFAVVRHLSFRRLSEFPGAGISDLQLRVIQSELAKLDPSAPECRRGVEVVVSAH